MDFLSDASWFLTDQMLAWLLYRAWRNKLFHRYRFFFAYILFVAVGELIRLKFYLSLDVCDEGSYLKYSLAYWVTEFIYAAVGFGITWEIYAHMLAPYRGVRRMSRAVLGLLFTLVMAKAMAGLGARPIHNLGPTTVELERNLRALQGLLLVGIVALVVHYSLPMGRNVGSMLKGYALYISCSVVALSVRVIFGAPAQPYRDWIERLAYFAALIIWCVGLWSYSKEPAMNAIIEYDYDRIASKTVRALGQLKDHVTTSWRL